MNSTVKTPSCCVAHTLPAPSERVRIFARSKTRRQALSIAALSLIASVASSMVFAAPPAPNTLPTGGAVAAGSATISQSGNTMNINQSSQRAVINWQSFNVGKDATVNFNQPNANASTLNRVNSATASMINGAVNSNGQVIFVNPNGVIFGKGAEINTGGIVATTMNISDKDYMDGKHSYSGNGTGKVVNKGRITVNNVDGYIALMAPEVKNEGVLIASMSGKNAVALVSGEKVTLTFSGNQLITVNVDASAVKSLISNKRLIQVDGGQIIIAANAASDLKASVINNTGAMIATGIDKSGGKIVLTGGTVNQNGIIAADSVSSNAANTVTNTATNTTNATNAVPDTKLVGGKINLVGNTINLGSQSKTTAIGEAGGGQIVIGAKASSVSEGQKLTTNDAQTAQMATQVTVLEGAVIDSSASKAGNGGMISIWSLVKTTVGGILNSLGGAISGNGGFIETSSIGQVVLNSTLKVDTSAANGRSGRWLLDPISLTIDSAGASVISNALLTSNVILDVTGAACPGYGTCTNSAQGQLTFLLGADIYSANALTSLSVFANDGIINVNNNITAGQVYMVAQAINVNGSINTNGGTNSQIYLAGAAINILGSIGSNGSNNNQGNQSNQNIQNSANTLNTTRRSNGINGGLISDTDTYTSNGGAISVIASGDIHIGLDANITANGLSGGTINIASKDGAVKVNGIIDAVGKESLGGNIIVSGKTHTELIGALISADGLSQGGLISIGNNNTNGSGSTLAPPAMAPPATAPPAFATSVAQYIPNSFTVISQQVTLNSDTGISASANQTANQANNNSVVNTPASQLGGTIHILGDSILLAGNTQIQAIGSNGGGTVLVGGDWQGGNNVYQATTVTMESGSTINASATNNGNGGKIVLWSDIHNPNSVTAVYGTLKAEGGVNGGNGGQIETSGYALDANPVLVSTSAAYGQLGSWLLDPYNITISTAAQVNVDANYTSTANNAIVNVATLAAALDTNNITVSAGSGGSQSGNITISSLLSYTGSRNTTLTLSPNSSGGTVNLFDSISATGTGSLSITVNGQLNVIGNQAISTNGGALNVSGSIKSIAPQIIFGLDGVNWYRIGGSTNYISGALANSPTYFGSQIGTIDWNPTTRAFSWIAPSNLTNLYFTAVGGGGGGSSGYTGAGGGGGGYSYVTQSVSGGTSITLTVGAGGVASYQSSGAAGSSTSITGAGITTVSASGGAGGLTSGIGGAGGSGTTRTGGAGGNNGNNGGVGASSPLIPGAYLGGGGGGNGAAANAGYTATAGNGGNGRSGSNGDSGLDGMAGVSWTLSSSLTVNAGAGQVTLTGGATGLSVLSVSSTSNASTIPGPVTGAGSFTYAGGNTGVLTNSGTISYTGGTFINSGTWQVSGGVSVSIQDLTIGGTGIVDLRSSSLFSVNTLSIASGGYIRNTLGNAQLTVLGTASLAGSATAAVTTGASQKYTGAVTLTGATKLVTTNSNVLFFSAVDSDATTARALQFATGTGAVSFGGSVGATHALASLVSTGTGNVNLYYGSTLTTTGNITVAGGLGFDQSTSINTNGGNLSISGALTALATILQFAPTSTPGSYSYGVFDGVATASATNILGGALGTISWDGTSYTWVAPANLTAASFMSVGGGGGGGSGNASGTGGGGGGGGQAVLNATQLIGNNQSLTITVGVGGTANSAQAGGLGGNTTISGAGFTTVSAAGGAGGDFVATSNLTSDALGGAGGGVGVPGALIGGVGGTANNVAAVNRGSKPAVGGIGGGGNYSSITDTFLGGGGGGGASGGSTVTPGADNNGQPVSYGNGGSGGDGSGYLHAGVVGRAGIAAISWVRTSDFVINAGSGNVTITGGASNLKSFTVNSSGSASSIAGAISGTTTLTYVGAGSSSSGTLTLSGTNTYTGLTTISSGKLAVTNIAGLGDTSVGTVIESGATLDLQNVIVGAEPVTVSGGTIAVTTGTSSLSGNVTLGANSTINVTGTQLTLSGVMSDGSHSYGISKNGVGILVLSGANTYAGTTTLNAGVVSVGAVADGGVASNLGQSTSAAANLVFNGGSLKYTGATASTDRAFTINADKTATINVSTSSSTLTISGSIPSTNGALTKSGEGTLVLTGSELYTGDTSVAAGTLKIGGAGSLNGGTYAGAIGVATGSTFEYGSSVDQTLSGVISGAGALTMSGASTLKLSAANSYTGATLVSAGTLAITNATGLGTTAAGTTISSGATLDLQNVTGVAEALTINGGTLAVITGTSSLSGDVTFGADSTINVATTTTSGTTTNNQLTISGVISGTGYGFTKTGAGMVILSAGNSYTGATTINAGTVQITNGLGLGTTAGITTVNSGAVLDLYDVTTSEAITLNGGMLKDVTSTAAGNITLTANSFMSATNSDDVLTVSGVISGSYGLTIQGTGTVVFSGNNTYTGTTTVSSGALQVVSNTGLGDVAGGTSVTAGATLDLQNVTIGNEGITLNSNAPVAPSTTPVVATLLVSKGSATTGTSSLSGTVSLAGTASSVIKVNDSTEMTLSGAISGTQGFDKTDTGTLILTSANTYSGATYVGAGTLQITKPTGLGTTGGNTTVSGIGTLDLKAIGATAVAENVVLNGGTLSTSSGSSELSGTVILGNNSTVNVDGTALTISGVISRDSQQAGPYGFTKTGTGTLLLTTSNTYDGVTTINAGTLAITNNSALGTATGTTDNTVIASGATLDLRSVTGVSELLSIGGGTLSTSSGTSSQTGAITLTADSTVSAGSSAQLTLSGVISGASFGITKTGVGTAILNATNTYTGTTTVTAGTLSLGQINALADTSALAVSGGTFGIGTYSDTVKTVSISGGEISGSTGVLTASDSYSATPAESITATISAMIGGTANLTKTGLGTLVLSGNNGSTPGSNYTGGVTVSAGILKLGYEDSFGNAASVTVGSGGTIDLAGYGTDNAMSIKGIGTQGTAANSLPLGALINSSNTGSTISTGALTISGDTFIGGTGDITVSSKVIAGSNQIGFIGTGSYSLTNVLNTISTVAAYDINPTLTGASGLTVFSDSALSMGSVTWTPVGGTQTGADGVQINGNVILNTTKTLNINQTVASFSNSVALTGSKINNSVGASAITVGTGKNWTILSTNSNPFATDGTGDVMGGVPFAYIQYNSTWTGGSIFTGQGADVSGIHYTYAPTINVTLGSPDAITKVYDGNTTSPTLTANNYSYSTTGVNGDTNLAINWVASGTYNSANVVDANTLTVNGVSYLSGTTSGVNGKPVYGYTIASSTGVVPTTAGRLTGAAAITAKTVSLSATKTYDGNTDLTGSVTIGALIGSQNLTYTGAIANSANVVSGNYINAIVLADGAGTNAGLASNYQLPSLMTASSSAPTNTVTINAKALSITADAQSTTYGTALVLGTSAFTTSGLISGESIASVTLKQNSVTTVPSTANAGTYSGNTNGIITSAAVAGSGTDLNNYSITYNTGTLTIDRKALTITADAKTMQYGDSVPALTYAIAGTVNGDTASFTGALSTTATSSSNVGAYAISQNTLAATGNYSIGTYVGNDVTITARSLTVVADAKSMTYGDAVPALTYTYSGQVSGQTPTFTGALSTTASNTSNVGTYAIAQNSLATSGNYTIGTYTGADITVGQKALSITASDQSTTYGTALTLGTTAFTTSGLVNSDAVTSVVLRQAGSTTVPAIRNAGTYTGSINGIVASNAAGSGLTNYSISYNTGTLTVSQKSLTITANDQSTTYGTGLALGTTAVTANGLVNGDTVASATLTQAGNTTVPGTQNAGAYTGATNGILATSAVAGVGTDLNNYSITYAQGSLSINQKALTISATNQTTEYGTALALGTSAFTVSGLENSNTIASVTLQQNSLATVPGTTNAGTYSGSTNGIIASAPVASAGTDLNNYTINFSPGTLTVTPKAITISGLLADNKVYDATTTATVQNLTFNTGINGNTIAVTAGGTFANANVGNGKTVTLANASYTAGSGTTLANYTITDQASTTANISPATLTVTANDSAKLVGGTDPVGYGGVAYSGFKGGDNTSSLTGAATVLRTGSETAPATYTGVLNASGLTANNGNYTINYVAGNFTIVPANELLVTVNNQTGSSSVTYGSTINYTISSAAYSGTVGGSSVVVPVTVRQQPSQANNWIAIVEDTQGGATATFTVSPGGTNSGAGFLKVGAYQLSPTNASTTSGTHFDNTITLTGAIDISKASLTASVATAPTKVYDGTNDLSATINVATVKVNDVVSATGTGSFNSVNANATVAYSISGVTLSGADAGNYFVSNTSFTGNGSITAKALTVSGFTASNKTYDGNNTATITNLGTLSTGVGLETLTLGTSGVSAAFADANAATSKTVTASGYTMSDGSGANAGLASNYTLTTTATTTANIAKKDVTISGFAVAGKTYDATRSVDTVTSWGTVTTGVGSQTLTLNSSAATVSFDSANAGTQGVTATGYTIADGSGLASNYNLTSTSATTTAIITAKALTVSGQSAANKIYDATNTATLSGGSLSGVMGADAGNVSLVQAGTFASVNAANGIAITAANTLSGSAASNYTVSQPTGITANIEKLAITVSGITASNKVYDGGTSATTNATVGAPISINTGVGTQAITVSATGAFADKSVADNKTVTLTSTYGYINGALAGNYTITDQASTTANITPKALTVSGITAANKTYDGTTDATVSTSGISLSGLVAGDTVTPTVTGSFANKNAENSKTVTLVSTWGGADAGNYTITNQASTTANIAKRAVEIGGITAAEKAYDGTTTATINTGSLTYTNGGFVTGDAVTVGITGAFASADVARSGGAVVAQNVNLTTTVSGSDSGNYSITTNATAPTAKITPVALTVTANGASDLINQVVTGTGTFQGASYSGFVNGETETSVGVLGGALVITRTGTQTAPNTYSDVLTPSGLTANNYAISFVKGNYTIVGYDQLLIKFGNTTAIYGSTPSYSISSAQYVKTVSGVDTTYSVSSSIAGSTVTITDPLGGGATFTVVPTGASTSTTGKTNVGTYTLGTSNITETSPNFSSTIAVTGDLTVNQKSLTISTTAPSKVYDGTTSIAGTTLGLTGKETGDVVTVDTALSTGAFSAKNVGTGLSYSITGLGITGADAANYTLSSNSISGTNGEIIAKAITVSGVTASNKVYDGTTSATVSATNATLTGLVSGETIDLSVSNGQFADKNAGTSKTVSFSSSYTAGSGTSLSNYSITNQSSATADITAKAVTVTGAAASNKVYDGTTDAVLSSQGAIDTGIAGETITVSSTGSYGDKNVGAGKTISLSSTYVASNNTSLANYTITDQASTTASITKKDLTLAGSVSIDKTYDGTTTLPTGNTGYGTLLGIVAGDTVSASGAPVYASASANPTVAINQGSVVLGGADAANYNLAWTNGSGTINQAPLNVSVNNAADLINQVVTGTAAYQGVAYSGFVNSETASNLGGTLAITRAGTQTAVNTYTGVLTANGLTSTNYNITYKAGDYTIVGYDQLLVKMTDVTATYSASPTYTVSSAQYVKQATGGGSDTTYTVSTSVTGASIAVTEGSTQTASFTIAPSGTTLSTSNNVNVGTYSLGATNITETSTNFSNTIVVTGKLSVTQKSLTGSVATANATKVYDGNTSINSVDLSLSGLIVGDAVTGSGSLAFANKNVGTGKSYTVSSGAITGADAANYDLAGTTISGSNGVITAKAVTVSGITANDKVYDRTTTATTDTSGVVFSGMVSGDALTVTATGTFGNFNVGTNKTVTLASTYGGADVGNYNFTSQTSATASITPLAITVSGITAANKDYDGVTTATISAAGITYSNGGFITGDTITPTITGNFNNKNVGTGKTVDLTTTWTGNSAGNYTITDQASTTADITAKTLTLAGSTGVTKTYDGTTNMLSNVNGYGSLVGVVSGDAVSVNGTAAFDSANAGSRVVQQGTAALAGTDAGNYILSWTNGAGSISKAALSITANAAADLVGQSQTSGAFQGAAYSGFVNGETTADLAGALSIARTGTQTGAGTYSNVLTPSGFTSSNYDITYSAGNYTIVGYDQLLVKMNNVSTTYGSSAAYTINTAQYVKQGTGGNPDTVVTVSSSINGSAVSISDGSSGTAAFTVIPSGTSNSSSGNVNAGTYTLGASNITETSPNFSNNIVVTGDLTVSKKELTASASSPSKTYDGTTNLPTLSIVLAGLISGDTVRATAAGSYTSKNVGTTTYDVSNILTSGTDGGNYFVGNSTFSGTNGVITAKALTVSGITAASKTYDGTRNATIDATGVVMTGLVAGDDVTLSSSTGLFNTIHAGAGKSVALTNTYAGTDKANYTIADQTSTTADISKLAVVVAGITANDKTYNGTSVAVVNVGGATVTTSAPGDTISVTGATGAFASKNAVVNGTVNLSGLTYAITGNGLLSDYDITPQASTTATINPKVLTVSNQAAGNKVYDGGTTATLTGGQLSGVISGDTVNLLQAGGFASANVANGIAVTAANTIIGTDAANYSITQPTLTPANITPAALTITANNDAKFYGQNDTPGYNGVSYSGLVNGETSAVLGGVLNIVRNSVINTSGNQIGVLAPSGLTSGNYTISFANGNFNIVPAGQLLIVVSNVSTAYGNTPQYAVSSAKYLSTTGNTIVDLTNNVTVNQATGLVTVSDPMGGGSTFNINPQGAQYSTSNNLRVGNYSLGAANVSGNSADFSNTVNMTGVSTITALQLTPSLTSPSQVYNGQTVFNNTPITLGGAVNGDQISAAGITTYAGRNVGTNIDYSVSSIHLSGNDTGNYYLANTGFNGNNGVITPKPVTLTAPTISKVYDGNMSYTTNSADLSALSTQLGVTGDTVTAATLAYLNANAGTGKAVTTSAAMISDGNNGNNYTISYATANVGTITQAPLTVTLTGTDAKVYDGTTAANLAQNNYAVTGLIGSDAVTFSSNASYASKNVAAGILVAANSIATVAGSAQSDNYYVTNTTASGNIGTITAKAVTLSAPAISKVYDGNLSYATTSADLTAISAQLGVTGDSVTAATFTYVDPNAGNGKAVTTSNAVISDGNGGNNYIVTYGSSNLGVITQAPLTVGLVGTYTKVYDATTVANLVPANYAISGLIGSDTVSLTANANFASKNVGSNLLITADNFVTSGNSNYYVINTTASGNIGTITKATLIISGVNANNKVYDGNTAGTLSGIPSVSPLGSDIVTVGGTPIATFASAAIGNNIPVAVAGYTLSGADAGNYDVVQPAGLTANITDVPIPPAPPTPITPSTTVSTATILTNGWDNNFTFGNGMPLPTPSVPSISSSGTPPDTSSSPTSGSSSGNVPPGFYGSTLSAGQERYVLLPDENGNVGAISVEVAGKDAVINEAYGSLDVDGDSGLAPGSSSKSAIKEIYQNLQDGVPPRFKYIVYFKSNSADELTPESYKTLTQLYEKLQELPATTKVNVIGHTDVKGSSEANYKLSMKRAEYVSQLLARHQVAQARIHLEAKGETDPMVDPAKAGAARRNRRVEISIP